MKETKEELNPHQYAIVNDVYNCLVEQISSKEQYPEVVLSGRAGTGKTFALKFLQRMFEDRGFTTSSTAPTHKAAQVLRQKTGRKVSTLARFLNIRPYRHEGKEVFRPVFTLEEEEVDIVIIDEASMVSYEYIEYLREKMGRGKLRGVVYCGDRYQLPPILSNKQKQDLLVMGKDISENAIPCFEEIQQQFELMQIVRQKMGNPIIDMGDDIRNHLDEEIPYKNIWGWASRGIMNVGMEETLDTYATMVKEDRDFAEANCFVSFTNNVVDNINRQIRKKVYGNDIDDIVQGEYVIMQKPVVESIPEVEVRKGKAYEMDPNDPAFKFPEILANNGEVMRIDGVTKERYQRTYYYDIEKKKCLNPIEAKEAVRRISAGESEKYEVYELDIPTYRCLFKNGSTYFHRYIVSHEAKVKFDETLKWLAQRKAWGANINYYWQLKDDFVSVKHVYAMTIHKSQGSTFENCFLVVKRLPFETNVDLHNRLLYVGVTRPSQDLYIVRWENKYI